jgi:DNA polymerase III subunit delta'
LKGSDRTYPGSGAYKNLISFSRIIGQEKAKQFLKGAMAQKKMPHAYLFTGIPGIGKTSTAMALAMALNCREPVDGENCGRCPSCRQMKGGNYPDFISIAHMPNKKNILIDQIRDLNRSLGFAPVAGDYRVCVVHRAETMTEEAANSFLKTLEEPPPGNILILKATEPRDLLPTIVSRCQKVSFQPLKVAEMVPWLVREKGQDEETAEVLARISGGSLGRALRMLETGFLEKRREWLLMLLELPGLSRDRALEMAMDIAPSGTATGMDTNNNGKTGVLDMLGVWEGWYRDLLIVKVGGEQGLLMNMDYSNKLKKIAGNYILQSLIDSLMTIDQALKDLWRNRNSKLVLQSSVLRLNRLAARKERVLPR